MEIEQLNKLWQSVRRRPLRTAIYVSGVGILSVLSMWATGYFGERGRQAASPQSNLSSQEEGTSSPKEVASSRSEMPVLSPTQERLLELIAGYQKQFAVNKLIISRRTGELYFDENPQRGRDLSLIKDLYGKNVEVARRAADFENLVEGMPSDYVRSFSEARMDNPFVISVTEKGTKYLHSK